MAGITFTYQFLVFRTKQLNDIPMLSGAISEVRTPIRTQISQRLQKFLCSKSNQTWIHLGAQTNKRGSA